MTKKELLNSAKNIEKAAKELLAKTSALRTDTGSALQAAKRLESQLQVKEKEARENAEKEAAQARENAEREAAEARERAEREAVEARERAEREASEAHERAEREAAQAREKAERKILEEQEKAAERKEKSSIEGQSGTAAPENAENTEKSEHGKAPAEKAEIKPVKETQSREIPGGTEKGTEMQNEKKKSAASAAEAKTAEKTSKNLESIIRLVKNGSGISDVRSSEHEGGSRAWDRRNGERRQSGDSRQGAEDRRNGERRQTGDGRQGAEDRRNGERRQSSDSRQGAEDRRSGERRQTGDGRQGTEDRRSGERRQTGESRQSAGDDSRKYGQRRSERGFERSSFDGEKRTGTERQRTGRGTEGRSDTRFPQGKTNSDIRDKDKDSFSGKSRQQSSHYQQHKQDLPSGGRESRAQENKGTYVRTFDIEKKGKNKKTIMKETAPSSKNWEDEGRNYGTRRKKIKTAEQHKPEPVVISKAIITTELITVRDFSEKIGKPAAEIIKKLFMMGIIANINQEIDFDTCQLVAMDYEIELEQQLAKSFEETMQASAEEADTEEQLIPRPPVVTIMGHVDHGKTSLLDAIRNSSVTSGEAGGITQHIGAYTVKCNDRMITFIDTPGHEAFTAMRARGAQVTDVVILVVAADDGIMPQTVEAINHSKAANVPIIVAINKIDKPEADPDRVKKQLTEYGLVCEEWGGDIICVPISAKKQLNLDNLLEMVLLQADILELRANPDRAAKGTIIESKLDKGRGPVATVLVQNGTLKVGDPIVAGTVYGKVRAMTDDRGRFVKSAGPSQPVEVLGFNEVPEAGDTMNVAEVSKKVAEERRTKQKVEQMKNLSKASLEDLFAGAAEGEIKTLNLIIKADVHGSVEAVTQALEKLSNDEVHIKCIHGGVGGINESDIMFASASNAIVIGFNVRPDSGARALAEQEKVDIRTYRVIYQAIEDVENAMKGMFKPVYREVQLGTVSVRSIFKISGVGVIAGCYVQEGKVERNSLVRLVRDGIVIHEGKIASLRRFKDDVKEVAAGYECGIGIENFNDIAEGDIIEAYITEEVKR